MNLRGQPIDILAPLGGVSRRWAYRYGEPVRCASALNVVPFDPLTGRQRISTRPGITATGATIGTPYAWAEATYVNSGTKRGVAVTTSTGTWISTSGSAWTEFITTNPGTDFASCAVYQQMLYQAAGGASTRVQDLTGSAGAGTAIDTIETAGNAPTNCGIVQTSMGRLWLAGDTSNPHRLYSPRQGTPTDWDYAPAVPDQAMAWASGGTNGHIGAPITALIDHGTHCLGIGCQDSMYFINGNPTAGGRLFKTASMVGPLMQSAHCKDGRNNTWFLSRKGLGYIPAGCPSENFEPTMVSEDLLPADLLAIAPESGDHVSIEFDLRFNGLHIYVDYFSGNDVAYFYDFRTGGFWPMSFAAGTMRLGAVLKSAMSATKSSLLMLLADGTVYQFDTGSSESVDSNIVYNPISLGDASSEGMLIDLTGTLAENSGSVAATVYVGDSEQETTVAAIAGASPSFTCDAWTRDASPARSTQYWQHPRQSGRCFCLRLDDVASADWSLESAVGTRAILAGKSRVGAA